MILIVLIIFSNIVYADDVLRFSPRKTEKVKVQEVRHFTMKIKELEKKINDLEKKLVINEQKRKEKLKEKQNNKLKNNDLKNNPKDSLKEKKINHENALISSARKNHQLLKNYKSNFFACTKNVNKKVNGKFVELFITVNIRGMVEHIGFAQYPYGIKRSLRCLAKKISKIKFYNQTNSSIRFKEVFRLFIK